MARYVPIAASERRAIGNLINGTATHQDLVHAANVIAAYDNADDHVIDPVAAWKQQRTDDLYAVAQELTT